MNYELLKFGYFSLKYFFQKIYIFCFEKAEKERLIKCVIEGVREIKPEREREREKALREKTERERQRQREREKERQRESERQRERKRDRES